jgi:AcrR family transcriptional regulator
MTTGDTPRRGRGRPRTPGAEDRILTAALEEYGEHGWAGFTMDAVAHRAGVGKSTIYLRWPDKDSLLVRAVAARTVTFAGIDTGSLHGDLIELTVRLLRYLHSPGGWAAIRVTFDGASSPERMGDFAADLTWAHSQYVAEICQRAMARGEMVDDLPTGVVSETIYGAAVVNALSERLEGRQDDEEAIRLRAAQIVGTIVDGLRVPQDR